MKKFDHFENVNFVTRSRKGEWMLELVETCIPSHFVLDFSLSIKIWCTSRRGTFKKFAHTHTGMYWLKSSIGFTYEM
jgi:hypothetical protein